MRKGIDRDVIDECLEEASLTSDDQKIRELLEKKHYDPEQSDQKEKARMTRFLLGRGFPYDKVREALKSIS